MDYWSLTKEERKAYDEAEAHISSKCSIKCVCGRLCTGLHEQNCVRFKKAVEKEFLHRKREEKTS